ncbi:MAG: hypothetical protein AAB152_06510 [Candidatus Coatesbacteria bacterium]
MAIAREVGISPSRVTQILNLLKLAPPIQAHILGLPPVRNRVGLLEKHVRTLCRMPNPKLQLEVFGHLKAKVGRQSSSGPVSTPPAGLLEPDSASGEPSGPEVVA